jgi:LmbE family N-acetylglucosaminyl deacetylase
MVKAAKDGHRVVLVVATKGEKGEVPEGFLDDGETLGERRVKETERAAEILCVDRLEFLGYTDSGMIGTPENDLEGSFWTADVEEAAARLASILTDVQADVLTTYDDHGAYGHPDHIQVHRVGKRAAEIAGVDRVYQSTINRDYLIKGTRERAAEAPEGTEVPDFENAPDFGSPEAVITGAVDVAEFVEFKRAAMRAHASQISEQSFFLQMPDDAFVYAFGTEWFIRDGQGPGITETDIL